MSFFDSRRSKPTPQSSLSSAAATPYVELFPGVYPPPATTTSLSNVETDRPPMTDNLSLQIGAPTILIIITILAICLIFIIKRSVDHRRRSSRQNVRSRHDNAPNDIDLPTVLTYGQYLNSLRNVVVQHQDVSPDLPPSYDSATKYNIPPPTLTTSGFANGGYVGQEICSVQPPSYSEIIPSTTLKENSSNEINTKVVTSDGEQSTSATQDINHSEVNYSDEN